MQKLWKWAKNNWTLIIFPVGLITLFVSVWRCLFFRSSDIPEPMGVNVLRNHQKEVEILRENADRRDAQAKEEITKDMTIYREGGLDKIVDDVNKL